MRIAMYSCVLIVALMIPLNLQAGESGNRPSGGEVKLQFVEVRLDRVLEWFSSHADMNFILPHSHSAQRITILSSRPVPIEEAFQALEAALDAEYLKIKPVGRFSLVTRKEHRKERRAAK